MAAWLVLLVAAGTVVGGLQLAGFSLDARNLMSSQPDKRQRLGGGTDEAIVARLSEWQATPGVGAAARELLAVDPNLARSDARRLLDLVSAIGANPTAGRLWLVYAEQLLHAGYAKRHAMAALRMSQIVERRRASTMLKRAVIVIRAWELAPDDLRQTSVSELAALQPVLGASERAVVAQVVATKSPAVRAQIGAMLLAKLGKFDWTAKVMGF